MLSGVVGIKEFQANLPRFANKISQMGGHFLVTKRNRPAMVAIPFEDYQDIADIMLELNSPELLNDIEQARQEYSEGKTVEFEDYLKQFDD